MPGGRRLIGVPLVALGAVMAIASYRRWDANERAMRLGQPLPRSPLVPVVAGVVGITATVALVLVVGESL